MPEAKQAATKVAPKEVRHCKVIDLAAMMRGLEHVLFLRNGSVVNEARAWLACGLL
jgi:hypothetical protein